jgi:alpha-beta hydrolase superfamily lysophospholipase
MGGAIALRVAISNRGNPFDGVVVGAPAVESDLFPWLRDPARFDI